MKLKDQAIIVTGSCTGIGKAIAKLCVDEGAKVVINGLEADLAAETVAELGPDNAVSLVRDLTEEGCPEELVALAKEKFGGPSICRKKSFHLMLFGRALFTPSWKLH